jgi:hypothetical protein
MIHELVLLVMLYYAILAWTMLLVGYGIIGTSENTNHIDFIFYLG